MHGFGGGRFDIEAQTGFAQAPVQLLMDVVPFTHPHERQEAVRAPSALFAYGQMAPLLQVVIPEFHDAEQIRTRYMPAGMLPIRVGRLVHRPVARILDTQECRNRSDLAQTAASAGRNHDPRQTWVDGESRETTTELRHLVIVIDGLQLPQQTITVPDQTPVRCVHASSSRWTFSGVICRSGE